MSARHLAHALVLTLALSLAGLPAQAQGRRGGGSHGGGSRGGSHASARSSHPSGGAHSGAQARHPRPGTGSGYYGGHYGSRYGGYYGRYGYYGGYRPYYYGGYYAPYYGYGWGFYGSLSFGWPSYSGGYYSYPGYSAGYYAPAPAGAYDDRASEARRREADRVSDSDRDSVRIRLEVRPEDTSVYVDDAFRGPAGETKGLILAPGRHTIELVRPGYATERREVEVVMGSSRDVLVEMQRR